jgi:hypothetical protein
MAAAGNIYRHEHKDVGAREIWDTFTVHFPSLRVVIDTEIAAWESE